MFLNVANIVYATFCIKITELILKIIQDDQSFNRLVYDWLEEKNCSLKEVVLHRISSKIVNDTKI